MQTDGSVRAMHRTWGWAQGISPAPLPSAGHAAYHKQQQSAGSPFLTTEGPFWVSKIYSVGFFIFAILWMEPRASIWTYIPAYLTNVGLQR